MMKKSERKEAVSVGLSITKHEEHFTYVLEGIDCQTVESKHAGELSQPIELVRRCLAGEMDKNDAQKLGFPKKIERFVAQQKKCQRNGVSNERLCTPLDIPKKYSFLLQFHIFIVQLYYIYRNHRGKSRFLSVCIHGLKPSSYCSLTSEALLSNEDNGSVSYQVLSWHMKYHWFPRVFIGLPQGRYSHSGCWVSADHDPERKCIF